MTRTVQEHWQLIEAILHKKDRGQSQLTELQASVAGLLATPEGRESVRSRLNGEGGSFTGRHRFVEEVFRAFETAAPVLGELSPRDRRDLQAAVLKHTRPNMIGPTGTCFG